MSDDSVDHIKCDCDMHENMEAELNKAAYSSNVAKETFSGPVSGEHETLGVPTPGREEASSAPTPGREDVSSSPTPGGDETFRCAVPSEDEAFNAPTPRGDLSSENDENDDANCDANDDEDYDANDEDDGDYDVMDEMGNESDGWSPLDLPHSCNGLGFTSNPPSNRFGCADTEICLIYNSENRPRHCFYVCTERMMRVSGKWAHKNSACHHVAYSPFTVVINCDRDGIVDAARLLFSCIHEPDEPVSCVGEESALLARSTALALELGCLGVVEGIMHDFFTRFLERHASLMSRAYLHNVVYLAKKFRHALVFQVATQKLAVDFSCPPMGPRSNMWDGRNADHFVHMELVPILCGISRACIQAEREIIVEVERFLSGDQEGRHLDVPGHTEDCAVRASRQLRRGLASGNMLPLAKHTAYSLAVLVDSIRSAGGDDACASRKETAGNSHHPCQPLASLYGTLYKVLDKLEFSTCCF